jgi:SAM-dependent methyltransferase
MVAAYDAQRERILRHRPEADLWTGPSAARFREDPRRPLDAVLAEIASYLLPDDVLIDVGGGAGRLCLPLALRCREVINVDPSAGMRAQFEALAAAAAIENARFVQSGWLEAGEIKGDIVLCAHVTYFVRGISAFVAKMSRCARRRVIIHTNTVPPPNTTAQMFELVYGEPQALVPSHVELLRVLEEMGIAPHVTVLERPRGERAGALAVIPDRAAAVEAAMTGPWLRDGDAARVRALVEARFDELFVPVEGGYVRRLSRASQPVVITWETRAAA